MRYNDPLPLEPSRGRYRHYKGREYFVESLGRHTETGEIFVVYRALYGDTSAIWLRPRTMFMESVEIDGVSTPRFAYVGET